jgi:glycine/D-amino acid oxidase-like deaminating enzyme
MLKESNFWNDTVDITSGSIPISLPDRVDVAIIGGGYTGLSAARILAKHGAVVAVLEAESIGWGASSRNGGMVLTGLKLPMQTVIRRYGRGLAKQLFQCSLDSIDTVEQIINEEKIDCGFARTGHLLTANKPSHYRALADEVEFLSKEFNHDVRLVSPADLISEIGSEIYHGALVDETSGGLNPAQYLAGLASAAEKAGATLHSQARVHKIGRETHRYVVETEHGRLIAGQVLVATSGYTTRVTSKLRRRIIPVGSYIIATERIPETITRELSPKNRMIFDYKHFLNYFRFWEDRLIFGGRAAFYPETTSTIRKSADILHHDMLEIYPQLRNTKIEYVWGGTLDFAFDLMTHVGEMEGIFYSIGYAGHGVGLATYLGKTVAEAMLEGDIRDHPFAAIPFHGAPFGLYNGWPWFSPIVGAWYKFLDWIE